MGSPHNASWEEVQVAAASIIAQIRQTIGEVDHILAIEKGGIVPAGMILQAFPKATFNSIRYASYFGSNKFGEPTLTKGIEFRKFQGTRLLVVDEICDTGETFKHLCEHYLPDARYASLYVRETCKFNPEYWGWPIPEGVWINFPWEALSPEAEEEGIPF